MKQVIQSLKTGETRLETCPIPQVGQSDILIASTVSLLSSGTERILVNFGKASYLEKIRQQPDKVRQVLDKMKTDGVLSTMDAVKRKLDQSLPMGYCQVGVVEQVGSAVTGFARGDRVVSNGFHAEYVTVTEKLCASIPDAVSDEAASFTVLGAIALQGVRLAQVSIGEKVAVYGLGLIGLLTVQLLKAAGCHVVGIDYDATRLRLAEQFGAMTIDLSASPNPCDALAASPLGPALDAVLMTVSTQSDEPMHYAAGMCRQRGRIVLVGVTGLKLSRDDFYKKELSFQVSCSYGPGRYDPIYEQKGVDYPIGFVRWTAQRNFEAILQLLADNKLDVMPLITHRFAFEAAEQAYDVLVQRTPALGIVFQYATSRDVSTKARSVVLTSSARPEPSRVTLACIGAGNYAGGVLLPAFSKTHAKLKVIASKQGLSAVHYAKKLGFEKATTSLEDIWSDTSVNAVVIATQHHTHAQWVLAALAAGKHVFVEKPLCLTQAECDAIETAYQTTQGLHLMVGFNRRFAPFIQLAKSKIAPLNQPKSIVISVNAGYLPPTHWLHDPMLGGGRLLGEGCHFVDLLRFFIGFDIAHHVVTHHGLRESGRSDSATITLKFVDGSVGTVHYFSNGHPACSKERIEITCAGKHIEIDNYRKIKTHGFQKDISRTLWRQNKGQHACVTAFVEAIRAGHAAPILPAEIFEVARRSIEIGA